MMNLKKGASEPKSIDVQIEAAKQMFEHVMRRVQNNSSMPLFPSSFIRPPFCIKYSKNCSKRLCFCFLQRHDPFLPRRPCLSKLILQEERVTRLMDKGHMSISTSQRHSTSPTIGFHYPSRSLPD